MFRKTMDQIPDLSAFQGVLLSADNQYSFAKLKFRGGNEEKIKYIVEKLVNFLKEKNYITENGVVKEKCEEYKKLALYLVLNADLPELEDMTELPGAGALVWTLPTLPGTLLSELFRALHMRPFLYQLVAFSRPALALQLADACLADLQHCDPTPDPEHPALLAGALYRLTCRLPFSRAPPAAPAAALAGFRACLARLTAPSPDFPLDHRYRLLARTLTVTLRLIRTCLARFTSVQRFEDEDFADVYRATHDPDELATEDLDFKICAGPDGAILESLRACNALLLDRCAALVMGVSVDAFCAWSEYEDGGSDVQRAVGELCHETHAALRSVPDAADHRLVAMLEQIAIRPLDVEDVIDATDPAAIAASVRARDAPGAAWLAALLRRPALCRRPPLLRALRSEAATLDEDQSARLFDAIVGVSEDDTEDDALRRTVAIEAFRRCSDSTKDRILAEQFEEYFHDELATVEFEAELTETFNRLTAGGAGPGDALAAFVQSPGRTLERAVRAAADGAAQAELMLAVVERLGERRERCYAGQDEPALVRAVNVALDDAEADESDARRDRLARFVGELAARRLLPRGALLRRVALPRLQAALRRGGGGGGGGGLRGAALLLRGAASPPLGAPAPAAALLAALAQALDATLAPAAAAHAARGPLLELLDDMIRAYRDHITEKELQWLRGRLQRSAPLTRWHCAALGGVPAPGLARLIQRRPADVLLLSAREWAMLVPRGADERALARARAALRHASCATLRRGTPEARGCLFRAHAAAMRCIKNNYLSACPTEAQAEHVTSLVLALAGTEPELAALWAPLLGHAAPPARLAALAARLAAHTARHPDAAGAALLLARVRSLAV